MMFVKIAIFIMCVSFALMLISEAKIPINCIGSTCKYWGYNQQQDEKWMEQIKSDMDNSSYTTQQIQSTYDTPMDIINNVAKGMILVGNLIVGTLDGGYTLTAFFLCGGNSCDKTNDWGATASNLANIMRYVVYVVYAFGTAQFIRGLNIEK